MVTEGCEPVQCYRFVQNKDSVTVFQLAKQSSVLQPSVTMLQRQCYSIGERLKTVSVDVPRLPQAAVKVFIENVDERQQ